MRKKFIFYLFALLPFITNCVKLEQNKQLQHIATTVSEHPKHALVSLDSINYDCLTEEDKIFYDFLAIKAKDKAYIKHINDSLYLHVLRHYKKHKEDDIYPEVLYYGGRVYRDLGNFPTSLQYFQNALDLIGDNPNKISLKSSALSQSGRIQNSLRLYDKALQNLEKSIKLEETLKDSLNLMYDAQLIGSIYLNKKQYKSAEEYMKRARSIGKQISAEDTVQQDLYLASIYSKSNRHELAKKIIRRILKENLFEDRDNALTNAIGVYYRAQVFDSAYLYAREIINLENSNNLRYALHLSLTPDLINFIPKDSLTNYISKYLTVTENEFNKNPENEALIQDTYYNYSIHDRERAKLEAKSKRLTYLLLGIGVIMLFLCLIILYLRYRNNANKLKLFNSMEMVRNLEDSLRKERELSSNGKEIRIRIGNSEEELKQRYGKLLDDLKASGVLNLDLPKEITESKTYNTLHDFIRKNENIADANKFWDELEQMVVSSNENFISNLRALSIRSFNERDIRLALLIKCDVSLSEAAILFSKKESTISYRKDQLSKKLGNPEKYSSLSIEEIIRAL